MDLQQLAARVMQRADLLAGFTEEPGRITRRFRTPAMREAADTLAGWMRDAGMSVRQDNAGNVIGRYEAAHPGGRTLLIGSHFDSVRDAGRYDGPLGVLAGIAAVEALAGPLPFAIEVLAFADEEGLRYSTSYLGSKAFAGSFDPAYLDLLDDDGIRMAAAIRADGGDPAALAADRRSPADLIGYYEVHIEQGPVLEHEGLPVGLVTAISGQSRFQVTFNGQAGHAGTVPMHLRHDALCAAAEFIFAVETFARGNEGTLATVGRIAVEPGAGNVIPGKATISLDVRHPQNARREEAIRKLEAEATHVAELRGVQVEWTKMQENGSVECSPRLAGVLEQALTDLGIRLRRLPSGAGHDAVIMSAITGVAMLFVRCKGGISHNPAESVTVGDVATALAVLSCTLELLAAQEKGA